MRPFDMFKKKESTQSSETSIQEPKISAEKKKLLKKGKELGLNLDPNMSVYELEHRIAEAKPKEEPKKQASSRRGEY